MSKSKPQSPQPERSVVHPLLLQNPNQVYRPGRDGKGNWKITDSSNFPDFHFQPIPSAVSAMRQLAIHKETHSCSSRGELQLSVTKVVQQMQQGESKWQGKEHSGEPIIFLYPFLLCF